MVSGILPASAFNNERCFTSEEMACSLRLNYFTIRVVVIRSIVELLTHNRLAHNRREYIIRDIL